MPARRARALPSAADATELRDRIVSASIQLIEEEGLTKLSMREVARRAGVTHQAPYHHFADREAILGEIVAHGFQLLSACIERADPGPGATASDMIDRLSAVGEAYLEFACTHPELFRIMFRPELVNLDNCPGAQAEGDRVFSKVRQFIHDAVEAGLPALPSEDALVALYWSVGHGLACLILDGPLARKMPDTARDAQIRDVTAALRALLLASLKPAPSEPSAAKGGKSGRNDAKRTRR